MRYLPLVLLFVFEYAVGQSIMLKDPLPLSNRTLQSFETGIVMPLAQQPEVFTFDEPASIGKKKVGLAVLYSLLLPGMGELYVGDYGLGKYFTIAEGGLWITLGAVQWHATGLQDDARSFAVQHANITLDGKDDQYFVDIGEFNTVDNYNEQILRNRDAHKVYDPQSSYWKWDSDANRQTFSDLRVSSDERFNDVRFVVAAIGVNHIISAINAARLAISHNQSLDEAGLLNIKAGVIGGLAHPTGIQISFSKNF